jgi:carbamoyl-phosphate synthase (ammonia)
MLGADFAHDNLPALHAPLRPTKYVGIKSPMFSYTRLGGADPLLGVEMASTGEVACFGKNQHEAFLKALISSGFRMPKKNILLSAQSNFLGEVVHLAHKLQQLGFNLHSTHATHAFLKKHGIESIELDFPSEAMSENNVLHYLQEGHLDLVINLPTSDSVETENNYRIRRTTVDFSIPLLTNLSLARLFVESMDRHHKKPLLGLEAGSLFDYYRNEPEEDAWTNPVEFH